MKTKKEIFSNMLLVLSLLLFFMFITMYFVILAYVGASVQMPQVYNVLFYVGGVGFLPLFGVSVMLLMSE